MTGTELETPHVTNHRGGVKGLLRKKHTQIRIRPCFFRGNLSSQPVPYLCVGSRIFVFDYGAPLGAIILRVFVCKGGKFKKKKKDSNINNLEWHNFAITPDPFN